MDNLKTEPVSFSKTAMGHINALRENLNVDPALSLRVGIKDGGCAGQEFMLAFDIKTEEDEIFDIQGIPVIISKKQLMFVLGMNIDWEEDQTDKGFVFINSAKL